MHKNFIPVLVSTVFVLAACASRAQAPAPSSSPSSAPVQAASTPAKKALVARILKTQQPVIEGMSRAMAERPAQAVMEKAGVGLATNVPADKREATAKDIEGLVKKYLDEAVPLVTSRAIKIDRQ